MKSVIDGRDLHLDFTLVWSTPWTIRHDEAWRAKSRFKDRTTCARCRKETLEAFELPMVGSMKLSAEYCPDCTRFFVRETQKLYEDDDTFWCPRCGFPWVSVGGPGHIYACIFGHRWVCKTTKRATLLDEDDSTASEDCEPDSGDDFGDDFEEDDDDAEV